LSGSVPPIRDQVKNAAALKQTAFASHRSHGRLRPLAALALVRVGQGTAAWRQDRPSVKEASNGQLEPKRNIRAKAIERRESTFSRRPVR